MAVDLDGLSFVNHLLDFFLSYAEQCLFHTRFGTVAEKLCWKLFIDFQSKLAKNVLSNHFRRFSFIQKRSYRGNFL